MVVLATKVYVHGDARERALRSLGSLVDNAIGDLEVDVEIGIRHDGFPSVTISGADAAVARRALAADWGTVPPQEVGGRVGTLESWDAEGFLLDAGSQVRIPADRLELGPGRPDQLVERFGLVQHQRLEFAAGEQSGLAKEELDRLFEWRRGNGRVNVNSVTRGEVHATVNRAGHAPDVVGIERLGLLEQSIVCGEGTDPPGLVASLGGYLPGEMRCVVA